MLSCGAKRLLKNYMKHVEIHNRMIEKAKTCHQKELKEAAFKPSFHQDGKLDTKYEFPKDKRRAHMDDERDTSWRRQLQKSKGINSDRWGYSGFYELYPEEFYNDESHHKEDSYETIKHRSQDRQKEESQKNQKRRKRKNSSDSETQTRKSNTTTKLKSPSKRKTCDKLNSADADAKRYFENQCKKRKVCRYNYFHSSSI